MLLRQQPGKQLQKLKKRNGLELTLSTSTISTISTSLKFVFVAALRR